MDSVPYDVFTGAFLSKISEYDFFELDELNRNEIVDGYMKRAMAEFRYICKNDFLDNADDVNRCFNITISEKDLDEVANIVSEGMIVQWLKPYIYKQEILQNVLNTRDFTSYSPAEMILRLGGAYNKAQKDFISMAREYSFNKGNLTVLHI